MASCGLWVENGKEPFEEAVEKLSLRKNVIDHMVDEEERDDDITLVAVKVT